MSESNHRKWPLAIAFAIVVVVVGVAIASFERSSTRSQIDDWSLRQAQVVEAIVQDVIDGVGSDLEAIAGFVAAGEPDRASFRTFVDRIAGTTSALGIGHFSVVKAEDLDEHIAERRVTLDPNYDISGLDPTGLPIPIDREGRDLFYPIQLFAFGDFIEPLIPDDMPLMELGIGIDPGYNPRWREQIESIQPTQPGPVLSDFIEVDLDTVSFDRAFFVLVPVETVGEPQNLVVALMLEPLLLKDIDTVALDDIVWEIVPPGTTPARVDVKNARFYPIELPGTTWRLAIEPTDAALSTLVGTPAWIKGALSAVIAALFMLVTWLLFERRSENKRAARYQRAADDKDRFLASVSHELRTPLTVVSGLAYELSETNGKFKPEERSDLFEMLIDQTEELSGIVEDLLIAARNDIGKVTIHFGEVDVVREGRQAAEVAGADVVVASDPGLALADGQRVRQILRNLLSNANRYGGEIVRIVCSVDDDWIYVTVEDNGEGVPVEMCESIFESYQSAHQPDAAVRSVGLGLYISRNLARAMGGDLTYRHDNGWSRFCLRLAVVENATMLEPRAELAPTR